MTSPSKSHTADPDPVSTGQQQATDTRFKPGVSGNLSGRPRGSRNRIAGRFLDDVTEVWEAHGKEALITAIKREPMQFSKMVAGILPTQIVATTLTVSAEVDLANVEQARNFLRAYRMVRDAPLRSGTGRRSDLSGLEARWRLRATSLQDAS
jgi:hypothetical protein